MLLMVHVILLITVIIFLNPYADVLISARVNSFYTSVAMATKTFVPTVTILSQQ